MNNNTTNEPAIRGRIDKFIQRLDDKDYTIKPEAQYIACKTEAYGKKSLADMITMSISRYRYEQTMRSAIMCDQCITEAFAAGVIEEGEGLNTKNKKAKERIDQLEKEVETLNRQLAKAKKTLEEWKKEYSLLHGRHFGGDVLSP